MKNNLIRIFLVTCVVATTSTSIAHVANPIFHYAPARVILTGAIKVKKFPAPPKDEYVGDKAEIYRYLVLDHPIDILPQKGDRDADNEIQKNVKDVQMVKLEDYDETDTWVCEKCRQQNQLAKDQECGKCPNSNWSDKLTNKHVCVTGWLYSRVVRVVLVAHHFTEIKQP